MYGSKLDTLHNANNDSYGSQQKLNPSLLGEKIFKACEISDFTIQDFSGAPETQLSTLQCKCAQQETDEKRYILSCCSCRAASIAACCCWYVAAVDMIVVGVSIVG